jgi:hypothetical protein
VNVTYSSAVSPSVELRNPNGFEICCLGKEINGLRYLWRETPCSFKQAAIYSTLDSNLSTPPYIKFSEGRLFNMNDHFISY